MSADTDYQQRAACASPSCRRARRSSIDFDAQPSLDRRLVDDSPPCGSSRRVLRLALGVAAISAEVDAHARLVTFDPGVVSWCDRRDVTRRDLALGAVVHHDLHPT